MKTKQAIEIVGQLEDFLNIPSFLCEYLQKELEEEHYQEVIEYIIERKNEDVENQKEKCLKEIERLQGNIEILADDLGNIGYMLGLEEGSCYEDVLEEIRKLQKENIKLHSIIKEVREYVEKHPVDACHYISDILDKVDKE